MGDTCFDGILVYVPQESQEVGEVFAGLGLEAVLEEVACASVFLVEVLGIGDFESLHGLVDFLCALAVEEMDVIGHETVGIEGTGVGEPLSKGCVVLGKLFEELEESLAVGVIGEDVLTVDASEHDVVDA